MKRSKEITAAAIAWLRNHRKLAGLALVLLALGAGLAWYLAAASSDEKPFVTEEAGYGSIQETVTASGTVQPVQDVVLTFRSEGYVQDCFVSLGDSVAAGQVLAVEDPADFATRYSADLANLNQALASYEHIQAGQQPLLEQQEAQIMELETALRGAEQHLQRQNLLFQAGGSSQAELDAAQNEYDGALARYEAALTRLRQMEATQPEELEVAASQIDYARSQADLSARALGSARIEAPFDGYVALIQGNVGQWTSGGAPPVGTAPSSQFSIRVASRELRLSARINEIDIGKVAVGQEAEFTVDAYPGQVFQGRLASLAPMATQSGDTNSYEAVIQGFEPGLLKGGMPAAVDIKTARSDRVLLVSQAALSYARTYMFKQAQEEAVSDGQPAAEKKKADHQQYLIVMEAGQPTVRPVTTGLSDEQNVEITSGIEAGEEIVISGGI